MPASATVVVSTRGRPQGCARAAESIVAALGDADRLVVVDQSEDDATELALQDLATHEHRLTQMRSRRRGISAGHNLGATDAGTDLILFTDDDCIASPTWIDDWRDVFERQPEVGIGFGTVDCAPFDLRDGFTPHFKPGHTDRHGIDVFRQPAGSVGMGANTAVLNRAWKLVGGCDEFLGIGTRFGGAEEMDLAYRIVRQGFRLAHAAQPTVLHDGFRPGLAASALVQTNGMGTGAMYAKHARCGDVFALTLLLREVVQQSVQVGSRLATNRRPLGFRRLKSIMQGAIDARRLRVDHGRRLYCS